MTETQSPLPSQFRGARGMLDWSIATLSKTARVSVSTIVRIERGEAETARENDAVGAVQQAFEDKGVRFLADDGHGPGVRLEAQ